MRSRPRRLLRTRPPSESTSRCLVIAWRETRDLGDRFVIESGPPAQRRTTSFSRVSSPSAANTGATARTRAWAPGSAVDMALDVLGLAGPALAVHAESFVAPLRRDAVEARLAHREQGAA